ncbi:uroporphyrinogen-III synthase [Homoserinimonas hongtaonis]|uniref:uroporphyrinogen-III synthase n=1 Tax=Homoserinimonas hongtaonis TaxID=2079791 RepID=UPI000D379CFA|nr:uroporphyrinogen-III synthase [Salinibacterium hongtaonis]AWB89196.1 uroporphyrinogen III synthase [Salinibacterium hongtaonis]
MVTDRAASMTGRRVLVPRGGDLGRRLSELLTERGCEAVVAPVIDFAPPADPAPLAASLRTLAEGGYDWLAVTSATTVPVLAGIRLPDHTRVAAVGGGTALALHSAGFRVDYVPADDQSARGMLADWPEGGSRVLIPQSEIAAPTLAEGLRARGLEVDAVTAYRTVAAALRPDVVTMAAAGALSAVALTSASVAQQIARQLPPAALARTLMICVGEPTARAARASGLIVAAVASHSSAEGLVAAVEAAIIGDSPNEGF